MFWNISILMRTHYFGHFSVSTQYIKPCLSTNQPQYKSVRSNRLLTKSSCLVTYRHNCLNCCICYIMLSYKFKHLHYWLLLVYAYVNLLVIKLQQRTRYTNTEFSPLVLSLPKLRKICVLYDWSTHDFVLELYTFSKIKLWS